jgi:hypothetical protein
MRLAGSVLPVLLALASLSACTATTPVAKLKYLGISSTPDRNYHLKFESDQPLLELFAKNKHRKVVLAELVCSLDNDHNFDFGHRLKSFAKGGFDFIEKKKASGQTGYAFDSTLHFWEGAPTNMGSDQSLAKEELDVLLKAKESIPCKVRMTVYLSSPYYSETMLVPAKDILAVALPRQRQ